jgi:predicted amidohydrolase
MGRLTAVLALLALLPPPASRATGAELLTWDRSESDGGWTRWSPRPALAPIFAVVKAESDPWLGLAGGGRRYVFGGWRRTVTIDPGSAYRFHADVEASGLVNPRREIVCQVRWLGPGVGEEVAPEYVADQPGPSPRSIRCDEILTPPVGATSVEVSLLVQWAPDAEVAFREVSLSPARSPAGRSVRIATVYWRPTGPSTSAANVEAFAALIDRAAAHQPDLVLLSEAITSIGTGLSVEKAGQSPQGPAFQVLSAKARQHSAYIVYGAYETAGDLTYNSAFVVGRDGALVGVYRKVQLPVGEVEAGLSPGDAYAALDLDFGRVGILICHDTAFDEPARLLTLRGAELLLAPAWGGDLTQIRARAMDNGVWVATAGYDVASAIIDPAGEIRAQTWKGVGDGVAFHVAGLGAKMKRPWIGDWRSAVLKQRRPEAYGGLLEEPR